MSEDNQEPENAEDGVVYAADPKTIRADQGPCERRFQFDFELGLNDCEQQEIDFGEGDRFFN